MAVVLSWLEEARAAGLLGPDTMILATATPHGHPSARAVLLRGLDRRGFVFFTDTRSRKGEELGTNPRAALVLVWNELERQVRVEGTVEHVAPDESDAYFVRRPRGHQLGAWVSHQSRPLASREALVARMREVTEQFAGRDVSRPPYWGGYRVVPEEIELWQGRPDRLHDRVRHRRRLDGTGWDAQRLWP